MKRKTLTLHADTTSFDFAQHFLDWATDMHREFPDVNFQVELLDHPDQDEDEVAELNDNEWTPPPKPVSTALYNGALEEDG